MATSTPANALVQQRKDVRALLQSNAFQAQIKDAVPSFLKPDIMIRVALTTIQKTPDLMECTQESLLSSIIECAQLGLLPEGVLGQAYLVPFNDRKNHRRLCQLQIGYRGLITLARRSGEVKYIVAEPVYQCDEFDVQFAPERQLTHKPDFDNEERGQILQGDFIPEGFRGAYSLVKYKDGESDFEYMPIHQIERIRGKAQSGNNQFAPWMTNYEEMARKTPIRKLAKRVPLSVEFQKAAVLDEYNEQGVIAGEVKANLSDTVLAEVAQSTVATLADKYAQKSEPQTITVTQETVQAIQQQAQRESEAEEDTTGSTRGINTSASTESGAPPVSAYEGVPVQVDPSQASTSVANQQTTLGAAFDPFGDNQRPNESQHRSGARRGNR